MLGNKNDQNKEHSKCTILHILPLCDPAHPVIRIPIKKFITDCVSLATHFQSSLAPPSGQLTSFTCFPAKQSPGLLIGVRNQPAIVARSRPKICAASLSIMNFLIGIRIISNFYAVYDCFFNEYRIEIVRIAAITPKETRSGIGKKDDVNIFKPTKRRIAPRPVFNRIS